ncbi:Hypothetical protein CINCED_3A023133 [Cinara cedri]|uniref:Uncharacterized protein n=1 Tax=Cinara cedri TaxID=506608 RepID=A0A5E4NLL9_9HEMI|nr:Hypothetical protein CINCED_3A023133 [Cinara cedri]
MYPEKNVIRSIKCGWEISYECHSVDFVIFSFALVMALNSLFLWFNDINMYQFISDVHISILDILIFVCIMFHNL